MVRYLTAAVLVVIVSYGLVEAWPLIAGPSLSITTPRDGESFPGGIVRVEGRAGRAALLTLNGASVTRDANGNFSSTMTYPHGTSILAFVTADRFGRRITTTRTIFVPN